MNVYFISGLGADSRIFKNLKLPSNCKPVYLDWIKPKPNEPLANYAIRLSESIDASQPFSLIGLSLGGMIAVEIAKVHHPQNVILISSIPCIQCLPKYYRFGGFMRLHKIIPVYFFKKASFIKRFFTSETSNDKRLVREMIRNCDASFISWGMCAILNWNNKEVPQNLVHIHGSGDFILPKRFAKPTHVIHKGGHLMILNRAEEINCILRQVLMN